MCLVEYILEYSVIVVGVRRRDFVGEERRRRVQELHVGLDWGLVEVVGVGLITCGEGELVSRAHTLVERSKRKKKRCVRWSARKRKGESRWGETLRWPWTCGWSERLITWATVRVQMMWHCATDETMRAMRATLMWVSVEVVVGVRIVQCHVIMDVVMESASCSTMQS